MMFCRLFMEQPSYQCKASNKHTEEDFDTLNIKWIHLYARY